MIENRTIALNVERCRGILPRGGTILFTSRTNPYKVDGGGRAGPGDAAATSASTP